MKKMIVPYDINLCEEELKFEIGKKVSLNTAIFGFSRYETINHLKFKKIEGNKLVLFRGDEVTVRVSGNIEYILLEGENSCILIVNKSERKYSDYFINKKDIQKSYSSVYSIIDDKSLRNINVLDMPEYIGYEIVDHYNMRYKFRSKEKPDAKYIAYNIYDYLRFRIDSLVLRVKYVTPLVLKPTADRDYYTMEINIVFEESEIIRSINRSELIKSLLSCFKNAKLFKASKQDNLLTIIINHDNKYKIFGIELDDVGFIKDFSWTDTNKDVKDVVSKYFGIRYINRGDSICAE